jgi:predicted AAA+ superfamily ATPase
MVVVTMRTIFDNCEPWPDIVSGEICRFSVDATAVLVGHAPKPYGDPALFFARTYPTPGLRALLANVFCRLLGRVGSSNPIVGLHAQPGGGKTHGMAALVHIARRRVPSSKLTEFIHPGLYPPAPIRTVVLDGERSDPSHGIMTADGIRIQTPWGELAYQLAGTQGFERIELYDRTRQAPPTVVFRELLQDEPTLILLDRVTVLWRHAVRDWQDGESQITLFVKHLFAAVASTAQTALIYTLATDNDGPGGDPYHEENRQVIAAIAETHIATVCLQVFPVQDDEIIAALRRSLFKTISVPLPGTYPLHPRAFAYLRNKIAVVNTCHVFGGMLGVVAQSIQNLWKARPLGQHIIDVSDLDFTPVIERLAYQYWEQRGRPAGSANADWIRAEGEFRRLTG